jgi:signal transduction histidine kinase
LGWRFAERRSLATAPVLATEFAVIPGKVFGGLPRPAPAAWLVLPALLLVGWLAYQVQDAVHRHRDTTESVLRDYARLAAAEYARRLSILDYYGCEPALRPIRRALEAGQALPEPADVEMIEGPQQRHPMRIARYHFVLSLRRNGEADSLVINGGNPSPPVRAWIADTLAAHSRLAYQPDWDHALLYGSVHGEEHSLTYALLRDSTGVPTSACGFESHPEALRYFFQRTSTRQPLLPPTLASGRDSLVCVRVLDVSGHELYRSEPQYPERFAWRETLDVRNGRLVLAATLEPAGAEQLVIGGLPRSRLPQTLVLLALTAGLLVATLVHLRREHELARLRTDFVSSVSHELRTPLAQIRLFAETLLLGRVRSAEEKRRSLEIIDQEARRLTHLVENVLAFSRAERRAIRLALEPTTMAPLLHAVVDAFAPLATTRQVVLQREITPGIVAVVDAAAVRQMLLNLLDNAVKYGPAGQTVTVGSSLWESCVRIRVDDEGPGVAGRDRDRIWERFWRPPHQADGSTPGAGIGLAVVRELAGLHRGRVWVEAAPGGGARFVLELPEASAVPVPAAAEVSTAFSRPREG